MVPFSHSFETARETIERVSAVDCFLTFMMETDAQAEEIPLYCEEYGVTSYKLYMQARRIPAEDHNWPSRRAGLGVGIDDGTLYLVMEQVARYGAPAIAPSTRRTGIARVFERRLRDLVTTTWPPGPTAPPPAGGPPSGAYAYVAEQLGGAHGIQHATTPETFEQIREARRRGVELYAQTGPAWLGFSPLRRLAHQRAPAPPETQEALWQGPGPGDVDVVGSDHVAPWPTRPTARPCTARASGTAAPASRGSRPSCR